MPLSNEELLAQLQTRGFEEGFQRTPLKDIIGVLDSITSEDVENNGRKWVNAIYNFKELEVMESNSPYDLPIAQISISISNRKASAMGVLGDSIDKLLNVDDDGNPLPADTPKEMLKGQGYLIGKRQRWRMTGGHMQWDRVRGAETPRMCWEVVEVVGETEPYTPSVAPVTAPVTEAKATPAATKTAKKTSGKSSMQVALELLNGKTQQEWNQAVFQNSVVKADGALVSQIIQNTFLGPLEESGAVSKGVDGKYTVNLSM